MDRLLTGPQGKARRQRSSRLSFRLRSGLARSECTQEEGRRGNGCLLLGVLGLGALGVVRRRLFLLLVVNELFVKLLVLFSRHGALLGAS